MDERGDRSRARHRVRQPDEERNLRTLADAAKEEEQADRRDDYSAHFELVGVGGDSHIVERTDVREEHEHRDHESEVADAIHHKRLLARVGVGLVAEPESDEQVGAEPHPFPSHEGHDVVRAEDQQQHEEDEEVEVREIARVPRIVLHVANAEDVNQRTDAGDDEDHHHREAVELQRRVNLQRTHRHPDEQRVHVWRVHGACGGAAHCDEDRDGEAKGQHQHARADDAHDAGGRVPHGMRAVVPLVIVTVRAVVSVTSSRSVSSVATVVAVPVVAGIRRPDLCRRANRKRAVDQKADEWQRRQPPDKSGGGLGEGVCFRGGHPL